MTAGSPLGRAGALHPSGGCMTVTVTVTRAAFLFPVLLFCCEGAGGVGTSGDIYTHTHTFLLAKQ